MRAHKEHYQENGFVILKDVYSEEQLESLEAIVDHIYEQWFSTHREVWIKEDLINMHSLTLEHYFEDAPVRRLEFF